MPEQREQNQDRVRVLRIIQYEGPRKWVEQTIGNSIHGKVSLSNGASITAVTINEFPSIIDDAPVDEARQERIDEGFGIDLGDRMPGHIGGTR